MDAFSQFVINTSEVITGGDLYETYIGKDGDLYDTVNDRIVFF